MSTSWGTRTTALHGGKVKGEQASVHPIHVSSTFYVDEPVSFSAHEQGPEPQHIYTRWSNPTVGRLEAKLAMLENGAACRTFGSGMAATSALLLSLLSAGDHAVISDVQYAGTAELARGALKRLGVDVTLVNTADLRAVQAALRPATRIVWLESPCNPIMRLCDVPAIVAATREICGAAAEVVVDSTFGTPCATRPLDLGADWVVHSLTKYIGGHGDALGGCVVGADAGKVAELAVEGGIHFGGVLAPMNAFLIDRGLETLELRMRAHEENAQQVATYLENHPAVERVVWPGLASHPQHDLASRQMRNFSGMMTFRAKGGAEANKLLELELMASLKVVAYAVSLGHTRSLVFLMPTEDLLQSSFTGADEDGPLGYRAFADEGCFRLSVGIENADDICNDLGRCLNTFAK